MCKYMYNMMQVCTLYVVCTRNVVCVHMHMYIILCSSAQYTAYYSVIVSEVQAVCSLVSGQVMLAPLHSPLYGCSPPHAAETLITHWTLILPKSLIRPQS